MTGAEQQSTAAGNMDEDPFDDLFNLEERYFAEGFEQGRADGLRQSRFEARLFGIEKGFEKFVAMGKVHARARLWAARLPSFPPLSSSLYLKHDGHSPPFPSLTPPTEHPKRQDQGSSDLEEKEVAVAASALLPALVQKDHERLRKHIEALLALTDLSTLSPENTDDDVARFDERLKRALAKVKIVEKITGESESLPAAAGPIDGNEDGSGKPIRTKTADADMESFGLPG